MTSVSSAQQISAPAPALARTLARTLLHPFAQVGCGALLLAGPAIYNGFPVLYTDSTTYLADGRLVARAVFLHRLSDYYGMRSFFYSLGILPFHWNLSPWPVVFLQCLLTAWVLRLTMRCLAPHAVHRYFLPVLAGLATLTGAGWYAGMILPDILGPLAYLAIFLVAVVPHSLRRAERIGLYVLAWWGVAGHATHLLIAPAECLLLACLLLRHLSWRAALRRIAGSLAMVAVAAAAQLALHGYLYGHPSLNGERAPFLLARVIADGPGKWYLQAHCSRSGWVVCRYVDRLSSDTDQMLWSPNGLWQSATPDEQDLMVAQEMPVVIAVVRGYPGAQLKRSAHNAWQQFTQFGFDDLQPSDWIADDFTQIMPAARRQYIAGRQARNALPLDLLDALQFWTVIASTFIAAALLLRFRRSISSALFALAATIAFVLLLNAAIAGALSMPDDRFQCRIIWLAPFFAGLLIAACGKPRLARLSAARKL